MPFEGSAPAFSVMVFRVLLRSMLVMLARMQAVAMSDLRMMRGLLVMAVLEVLRRLTVMLGGVLVMFGSLFVMLVDFVIAHGALLVETPSASISTRHDSGETRVCRIGLTFVTELAPRFSQASQRAGSASVAAGPSTYRCVSASRRTSPPDTLISAATVTRASRQTAINAKVT
jgi:hypothetical protein